MGFNNKVDFIATVEVKNANPNGDPLAGNYPRTDTLGLGMMSDVSIKRKIRNRMQDEGLDIFVKSRERSDDGFTSLQKRYESALGETKDRKAMSDQEVHDAICEKWADVRSFGQVVTYDGKSVGVRGPVSIMIAKSLSPVNIVSMQITRSSNSMEATKDSGRSSDTMGTKQFVEYGVYIIKGSINPYFAEKTGFDVNDGNLIKECIRTLFVNDSSSARPEGSMEVKDIFWFTHPSKLGLVSSGKIFDLLEYQTVNGLEASEYEDYQIQLNQESLDELISQGLKVEHIDGL